MGEEAKKPRAEEESKKPHEGKQEKKPEDAKKEDKKKSEESKEAAPPPPPPPEIVLRVHMHCEGCARKVRRCLKGFDGVEEVVTECRSNKVVVKGEKADPLKVLERVQRKSHRHVELLSATSKPTPHPPSPPPQEEKKPQPTEQPPNPPDQKEEPKVVTVVLKVHMHCDACAQAMKKRSLRMKGVESAEPDLKGSQVAVRGALEPAKLVEYVYKRTGKHAAIVKQEPVEEEGEKKKKKEEEGGKDGGNIKEEEKKGGDGGDDDDDGGKDNKGGGEEEEMVENNLGLLEMKKMENMMYYPPPYYLPRFVPMEYYGNQYQPAAAYPPQMFSDDNPNACSLM